MAKKTIVPVQKQSIPARREELHPFSLLRQEMNSLFDNFLRGFEMEPFETRFGAFSPRVDIAETDKEIKITVELPGMEDKDVDVSLTKDMLTIKGEKKEEKEEKGKSFYRMERSYGSFSRSVPLPTEIDTNKVKADFKKGILTVTLPKTLQAIKETKKIQVKAE
ncbi:MAG: Hsp20/alpha crystallin family protein [Thermodesulfovibrionales bacterium]|nr:Hsp20/alpha crystallin family protein [Thermodesulfovibrionales bacterium]